MRPSLVVIAACELWRCSRQGGTATAQSCPPFNTAYSAVYFYRRPSGTFDIERVRRPEGGRRGGDAAGGHWLTLIFMFCDETAFKVSYDLSAG